MADIPAGAVAGDLFAGLGSDQVAALEAIAKTSTIPVGQRLFNLGEEAKRVLLILEGTVELTLPVVIRESSQEVTVDEKEAGSMVGWSALVSPHKYTLNGRAATAVTAISFSRDELEALFAEQPELDRIISRNLNRVIGGRVALLEGTLARILQRWAAEQ